MVKIPLSRLSHDALLGVVEEFVLREGTDYGHRDHTLAEKRERVLAQLRSGEAELHFDPVSRSIHIRPA